MIYAAGAFPWLWYPIIVTYERIALPELPLSFLEALCAIGLLGVLGLGFATVMRWPSFAIRYMLAVSMLPAVLGLEWSALVVSHWRATAPPTDDDPLQAVVALSSLSPLGAGCAVSAASFGLTMWTAVFLYRSELRARGSLSRTGDSRGRVMMTVIGASIGVLLAFCVEHARYRVRESMFSWDVHTVVPWLPVAMAVYMTGLVAASLPGLSARVSEDESTRLRRLAWVVPLCAAVLPLLSAEAFWAVDAMNGAARWIVGVPGFRGFAPGRIDPVARSLELFAAATIGLACSLPLWRPLRAWRGLPKAAIVVGVVLALGIYARVLSFNKETEGLTAQIATMFYGVR